ncbi:nuclease-related domain-containing protein [Pseudalkalibacillus sp. A8]|uniref:nuclease-related domain-containing protein n=1 Tax=Pseudalkalibacillus sp. A8 TaxID=3382641 RepID=UPI0038B41CF0
MSFGRYTLKFGRITLFFGRIKIMLYRGISVSVENSDLCNNKESDYLEVKPKRLPIYLEQLMALVNRTPLNHPSLQYIVENLMKSKAGYKGEKMLEYYLRRIPHNDYYIFHDLRLPSKMDYFQIDILLVSLKMIILIEIKNISGTLFFDGNFNQMIGGIGRLLYLSHESSCSFCWRT